VRTNDDPIFNDARASAGAEADFFGGAKERRCLGADEAIEDLMAEAARRALADAGLGPRDVDRLYGYAFVSEYLSPNGLYKVHHALGLDARAMVVPVNAEFSNFITSVVLAWEAVAAGRARHVLVVCGTSMTRHMNYASGHALAIGDGAAAAVVGPSTRFRLVDHEVCTLSEVFDVMTMKPRVVERHGQRFVAVGKDGVAAPIYEMNEAGLHTVMGHGVEVPPKMVRDLLARHGIASRDIAFIGHQPARSLMSHWQRAIEPGEYRDTYDALGNATLASVPITLAMHRNSIATRYIVLLSPGTGTHFAALLIER
jgi:3-oxoacyl-[acyl-carrier-protein] synthase-3